MYPPMQMQQTATPSRMHRRMRSMYCVVKLAAVRGASFSDRKGREEGGDGDGDEDEEGDDEGDVLLLVLDSVGVGVGVESSAGGVPDSTRAWSAATLIGFSWSVGSGSVVWQGRSRGRVAGWRGRWPGLMILGCVQFVVAWSCCWTARGRAAARKLPTISKSMRVWGNCMLVACKVRLADMRVRCWMCVWR
jgi:hypothetical protein